VGKAVAVVIGVGGMGQAIARRVGSSRALLVADVDVAALEVATEHRRRRI
jgi:ribosomal protein S9